MKRVLNSKYGVMVALQANNRYLKKDNGFPCRLVCPGYIGLRCVKWLDSITIQDQESNSYFQKIAYKPYKERNWS